MADGAPVTEPALLTLVETRVGEPLVMADVRQTIDHLVTLDVSPTSGSTASPTATACGCATR